ncbi:hypothetical protein CROQUDRAFT_653752 [Cronartium quercuum f. sp. fusiforme G11]|uniref:TspO/MBR-related protein n=1 Tax=Cronartium quercuum f. sp. fusiforme G11 TaxID=708437 RepID=A0A9P6TF71_9BASI|nr:hypothetical protein CROQUDRAFT_653752 [Cronartium quercuum f. sp. fusiforme G11]
MPLYSTIPISLLGISSNTPSAVLFPVALGTASGFITRTSVSTWYPTLKKPAYEPPRWAFPVAWTYLYASMGYASHLLAESIQRTSILEKAEMASTALELYYIQLGLNMLWTPLFFGFKKPGMALIEIIGLSSTVFWMTNISRKVNMKAFYLFLPYCAWLSYATYLNAGIWYLNGGKQKLSKLFKKSVQPKQD